jgi:hypothetical protein
MAAVLLISTFLILPSARALFTKEMHSAKNRNNFISCSQYLFGQIPMDKVSASGQHINYLLPKVYLNPI